MNQLINNPEYLLVKLVGNKYCEKRPSSKDTKLIFKYEKNNPHDSNAMKVFSKRDDQLNSLGYIERAKNVYLKSLMKNKSIKYKMIIQKKEYDEIEYFIVFKFKKSVIV